MEAGAAQVEKLAILGPGLLGGSVALAAEARGLAKTVALYGRSETSLEKVRAAPAAANWELTTDPAEAVWDADLVVLCTPVGVMASLAEAAKPALSENAIVTDVGSVKRYVVEQLAPVLKGAARFVPSHPMAGSERTGFEAAQADLFEHAMTILTPLPETEAEDVDRLRAFWSALGSRTTVLAPEVHDVLAAQISHLPHAAACALVHAAGAESLDLVGTGFLDTTRKAAGDPAMWAEIFTTNRLAMLEALARYEHEIRALRRYLEEGDGKDLHNWLAKANDVRSRWPGRNPA
ncbi:MAG: prephenate dehydrogenase/arogenate dehydrogenase family protein [Verrucomicrobiota bacterium]